jgi:hypothetical protein
LHPSIDNNHGVCEKVSVSTKRQIKSFWWAPAHPETRWFGTLTLELDQSPELELFVERNNPADDARPLGRVIHGKDEHGLPITLLFVGSAGDSTSGAVLKRTFHAGYALVGITLPDADSFVVNSLRFQVQQLYGWLGRSGFKQNAEDNTDTFAVHFRHQEDEWFSITSDLELGIHNTFTAQNGFQERRVSEDAALTFRSKTGFSLSRCRELVGSVRTLLHFASLKKVYPVWMTAYKNGHGYQSGGRWIDQDIEIVTSNLHEAKSEYPMPDRWLFRFDDVRDDFAGFVHTWLDYTQRFAESLGCYSSTIYHSLTAELAHLSLTQALEAYHGIQFSSHHKHEFQAKIEELGNLHATSLKGLVDDIPDFAERVLCTRNYYTHHSPKWLATGKVAKGIELIRLNEQLRLLFQMCVLTDLKIPADRFLRLRRQLATDIINYA